MWSPDGTQIVYYGRRWPAPKTSSSINILHALCTMRGDGTNVQPVRYTTCSGDHCPEAPGLIAWTQFGILYQSGGGVFRIVPGNKPQQIARPSAVGTRSAGSSSSKRTSFAAGASAALGEAYGKVATPLVTWAGGVM